MKKLFEPILGMISGLITWGFVETLLTAVAVGFLSAVAGWLGKEACVCVKKQITARRRKKH